MGAKARRRAAVRSVASSAFDGAAPEGGDVPVVGAREPCPCGSGRRYKACHGRAAARAADAPVPRPFAGLAGECDWVALREIVPAATAPLTLVGEHADRSVTLATVLPLAWPGLVRQDGRVLVGLQTTSPGADPSRDVAAALVRGLAADPGTPVEVGDVPVDGPRLQDLLDPSAPLEVRVESGFEFWVEGAEGADAAGSDVAASLEAANAAVVPTARLASVEAAYWAQLRSRTQLRWVLPYDEEPVLDAMARLHVTGDDRLGGLGRFLGSFRAQGLVVPVWDLPEGTEPEAVEDPAAAYGQRLADAMASPRPLTGDERRARAGQSGRQVTLRQ